MNKRYQVFISSTYADLKEERSKVTQTIMELDCIPAGMEIFPAIDEEQFEFIKKVIDDCDYYLLIIGGRYGSLSDDGISYTEKEYDYAIAKNIKVIAFLHNDPSNIPLGKSEKEAESRQKLEDFRTKVSTNRLIKYWETASDLPGLVALSLSKTIKTYPAIGWVRANSVAGPEVFQEMNELRKDNENLKKSIRELSMTESLNNEKLAGLEDNVTFTGTHTQWNSYSKRQDNSNWTFESTWGQVFAIISPYLLESPNDLIAKKIISQQLYNSSSEPSPSGTAELKEQDFQTLKIHFKTLGLINLSYGATVQGGSALFWELTKVGEQVLLELRSVKK